MSLTGNFIEDDANMEEINTGSSMSRARAKEIIHYCKTEKYAGYRFDDEDYREAKRVLKGE